MNPQQQALPGQSEATFAATKGGKRLREIVGVEFGPHPLGEMQLGIGAFPEQEIGEPLLAAGADDQIDIAQAGFACDELGKLFARRPRDPGQPCRGVEDRVSGRIVDRDAQVQRLAACGRSLRVGDRRSNAVG